MLTIDALRLFGANVQEGLERCMNNESFYLRMVRIAQQDQKIATLAPLVEAKSYHEAFEVAHALKGVFGNLALTPLTEPVSEITEHLRYGEDIDYGPLLERIQTAKEQLDSIAAE